MPKVLINVSPNISVLLSRYCLEKFFVFLSYIILPFFGSSLTNTPNKAVWASYLTNSLYFLKTTLQSSMDTFVLHFSVHLHWKNKSNSFLGVNFILIMTIACFSCSSILCDGQIQILLSSPVLSSSFWSSDIILVIFWFFLLIVSGQCLLWISIWITRSIIFTVVKFIRINYESYKII